MKYPEHITPRSILELSHAVARQLQQPITELERNCSRELCAEILARIDLMSDPLLSLSLRSWIGKLQTRFERSPIG